MMAICMHVSMYPGKAFTMWSQQQQQQKTSPVAIMTTGPEKMKHLWGKSMMVSKACLHSEDKLLIA